MAKRQSVTMWNILALFAGAIGAIATLALDQVAMKRWLGSGSSVPVGQHYKVQLREGQSLAYYESDGGAPRGDVTLYLLNQDGDRLRVRPPAEDISYRDWLSGRSGRALWQLDLAQTGEYTVRGINLNFEHDTEIPASDRIIFARSPDSLAEASASRSVIRFGGASVTIVAVVVFYILHSLTLRKGVAPRPMAAAWQAH